MTSHGDSTTTRRGFLSATGVAAIGAAVTGPAGAEDQQKPETRSEPAPQGQPDTTGRSDTEITASTIREAEKLAGVEFTDSERETIVETIGDEITRFQHRLEVELPHRLAPAQVFDPRLPGMRFESLSGQVRRNDRAPGPLPVSDESIAFAPVTSLSRWIERGELTSTRLTKLYLKRLKTIGPKLECVVTLTETRALEQSRRVDAEIAAGEYRGPLHGIPWGAKDLLDTSGIRTSWGAMPYKDRVAESDAAVVRMLTDAGAVLVAKLTLGALAYGDIWFGGRTNNPWNLEQGSSGSSAGSSAATAAGLVGFSLGTETLGSIVSPCMRCGTTGLRPTFGRVPRTGAMALCWSLDKIGPICRTVEDCALVLGAMNGPDPSDPSSIEMPYEFDGRHSVKGLRVGFAPSWFEGRRVSDIDRHALERLRETGVEMVEVELPDWPYGTLMTILMVEAASAFEEITLENTDDTMKWQAPQAWPNSFRATRFVPAIEYVQAERFRRKVMEMMAQQFERVDAMISPSYAGSLLLITNNTGHPSLTIRAGFRDNGTPHGITLWGGLFDEGRLCNLGVELERRLGVWDQRPDLT